MNEEEIKPRKSAPSFKTAHSAAEIYIHKCLGDSRLIVANKVDLLQH